ncbi:MAG: OmpA family protein [Rhodothermales bacterium]
MRAQARRITHEEEEESVFVSMTDMTVGFLFIMMILLAFFASMAQDQDNVSRLLYESVIEERDNFKKSLATQIALTETLKLRIVELEEINSDQEKQMANLIARIGKLEAEAKKKDITIVEMRKKIAELQELIDILRRPNPLEAYLAKVSQTRRDVLTKLRDAIREDFPNLKVELSEESDALRFQGEGLFGSGSSKLPLEKLKIVAKLAQRLDEVLPCYTAGENSDFSLNCNQSFVMIEAVQIEGHTDNVGSDELNRNLSAARANSTFFAMTKTAPRVMRHQNLKNQPVLSVAAYGPDRPVASNDTIAGRDTNRRIDLRFIMVTPRDTNGIATIKAALEGQTEADE